MSDSRRLLNATAIMASGTAVSRVLGFVRAIMIAIVLGNATQRVEVFNFAQMVPNSLYLLLAGGTLNSVLVPQIVRAIQHDKDGGQAFVDRIMTGFLMVLGVLTVLLTIGAPLVMSVYVNPVWHSPAMASQWQSLVLMSYITMPQIFFYGLFFLIGQVLNARDRFGPMMWAPIANNVVSIAMLGSYLALWGANAANNASFNEQQVWWLGVGSTLGIAIQTAILVPYLRKVGFRFHPRFDLRGTGLGQTFHVAKWMVGVVVLTSLTQLVISQLASTAAARAGGQAVGGLNAYSQAQLIWILPHSLLTVSLATAILPAASRLAAGGDLNGVAAETTRAIRLATTLIVPAAVAYLVLSDPFAKLIYGNGSGSGDYHVIAWALAAFALGLVPYTIQYLFLRGFYSLNDTRTTFFMQIVISVANAGLATVFVLLLSNPTTVAAWLAAAYSIAYLVGVFVTYAMLHKRLPALAGAPIGAHLVRVTIATLPAVAIAWLIVHFVGGLGGTAVLAVSIVVAAVVAVVVYFFVAKRMRVPEASELIGLLQHRRPTDDDTTIIHAAAVQPAGNVVDAMDAAEAGDIVEEITVPDTLGGQAPTASGEDDLGDVPAEQENTDPDGRGIFIPVDQPLEPLTYPEPTQPIPHVTDDPRIGQMLGNRYRLDEQLAQRGTTQTWRAFDDVLERPVLVHLLGADDPGAAHVIGLARRAAAATDARVLRVLDIVPPEPGAGAYLIYEYAAGQTLANMLASGPLTNDEAAWVVREVADTVAGLHAQGLYHGHLSPTTVLITSNGNIKLTGLLVNLGFDGLTPSSQDETRDVDALGDLLRACLTASRAWADELPPDDGLGPAMDTIIDRILSPAPRGGATRLRSAHSIEAALSLVLGPVSAAPDLQERLHASASDDAINYGAPALRPPRTDASGGTSVTPVDAPPAPALPVTMLSVSAPVRPDAFHEAGSPAARDFPEAATDLTGAESDDADEGFVAAALERSDIFTPVPPPADERRADDAPSRPRWLTPLVVSIGALLIFGATVASALVANTPFSVPSATPIPTDTPSAAALITVASAEDFDPKADGGDGSESAKDAPLAIDGKTSTAWRTEQYRSKPTYAGLKPGTGLVLDLGEPVSVSSVEVDLVGDGSSVELRMPTADEPSMETADDWTVVASAKDVGQTATLTPDAPVTTRYLLVYLTKLPPKDSYYQGGIAEVQVLG